jgi:hypothetical protein
VHEPDPTYETRPEFPWKERSITLLKQFQEGMKACAASLFVFIGNEITEIYTAVAPPFRTRRIPGLLNENARPVCDISIFPAFLLHKNSYFGLSLHDFPLDILKKSPL